VSSLLALALVAAAPSPKIAVLDLESQGVPQTLVGTLSLLVPSEVRQANPGAEIITTAEIRTLIGFERQKQLVGCKEDSSCIAELGGALGASELVSGSLGKVGNTYVLQLQRVDVRRARALGSVVDTVRGEDEALIQAVRAGIRRLFADVMAAAAADAVKARATGRSRWPGYTLTIGGGVLLLGGLVLTGIAAQQYGDLSNARKSNTAADYATYYAAHAPTLRGVNVSADVLTVAGVVGTAAGLAWTFGPFWGPSTSATVSVAPGSVALAGTF
jgi:hypothetical protein